MTDYVFETSTGEQIPVIIDTRRGLRNMTLRPKTNPKREIHISKPWLVTTASALRFVEQKRKWIEKIFARAPQKTKISDGDTIEFLEKRVRIKHDPTQRGNFYLNPHLSSSRRRPGSTASQILIAGDTMDPGLRRDDGVEILVIGGAPEHLERRVRDFIKAELLTEIRKIIKTAPREFAPARIALRDTSSRWGSCSSTGTVSFSWRLAFAPYEVMRYVVMHELAHKKYMDHSDHFWATVAQLYGEGVGRAKRWLTQHGGELHQYF